ncbi:hypothetical protein APE_1585 [Aeropyrum pernix K1]|uniref:CBS domain-containing protein n=1 Tax=Aeropyrum pernix (strain ATCC 700893 / DSM 11879 / JCM 9820 / NBRC 100138 / K1) TaxID=272557 RepID=Q9YBL3_AERPE|nr:CBS domain-containing protein [Aeropyrum pernix]BAA80585.1 hypothetical protein APE_1585 [Aeropyrum pernix K1]
MESELCLNISLDPSTPISSIIDSVGVAHHVVYVDSGATVADAVEKCIKEGCEFIIVKGREGEFAVSISDAVKSYSREKTAAELREEALFEASGNASIQKVITVLLASGKPGVAVKEGGRIVSIVALRLVSKLLSLEIDVEELRGAD